MPPLQTPTAPRGGSVALCRAMLRYVALSCGLLTVPGHPQSPEDRPRIGPKRPIIPSRWERPIIPSRSAEEAPRSRQDAPRSPQDVTRAASELRTWLLEGFSGHLVHFSTILGSKIRVFYVLCFRILLQNSFIGLKFASDISAAPGAATGRVL